MGKLHFSDAPSVSSHSMPRPLKVDLRRATHPIYTFFIPKTIEVIAVCLSDCLYRFLALIRRLYAVYILTRFIQPRENCFYIQFFFNGSICLLHPL